LSEKRGVIIPREKNRSRLKAEEVKKKGSSREKKVAPQGLEKDLDKGRTSKKGGKARLEKTKWGGSKTKGLQRGFRGKKKGKHQDDEG